MERTIKWEKGNLKVEFTITGTEGKLGMATKALKLSKKNTRYVPFKVFTGAKGSVHTASTNISGMDNSKVMDTVKGQIKSVEASYVSIHSANAMVDDLIDGLLSSDVSEEIGLTEVITD